jgi:hypothetical protein
MHGGEFRTHVLATNLWASLHASSPVFLVAGLHVLTATVKLALGVSLGGFWPVKPLGLLCASVLSIAEKKSEAVS